MSSVSSNASARKRDPELTSEPGAYCLWQWAMCESTGHRGNVIASPQAMTIAHAANREPDQAYPDEEGFRKLLALGRQVIEEETISV